MMNFAIEVAKHVINENLSKSKSVAFSPASLVAVLNILAAGAVDSTHEQLLKFLGHNDLEELNAASIKLSDTLKSSDDENTLEVSYVNALWLDQRFKLKQDFAKVLKEVHNAQATSVDFVNKPDKVAEEVNAWAEQETRGLIKKILARNNISKKTAMLLTNALYFKGMWQKTFLSENTKADSFNLLDGHKVRVPFMRQWNEKFHYGSFNDCQVIRMPYKRVESLNNNFSMYIFLPLEKDGLPNLIENIEFHENMFDEQFKLDNVKVNVLAIPKFKFESDVILNEALKQLGLTLPFQEDNKDFAGIVDDDKEPLYVSTIVQKCRVETNEKGTKAVAVTRGQLACMAPRRVGPPPKIITFVADHPFMFIIREDTSGAILFIGTMLNPKS